MYLNIKLLMLLPQTHAVSKIVRTKDIPLSQRLLLNISSGPCGFHPIAVVRMVNLLGVLCEE